MLGILYDCSINYTGQTEEKIYKLYEISANMKYAPAMEEMMRYSNRYKDEEKAKEWVKKILSETGLIENEKTIIRNAQDLLEELGENIEDKILIKDYEIKYDEDLKYFIAERIRNY